MVAASNAVAGIGTRRLKARAIAIRVNVDLKNAYRALLTRALQGMVIFVQPGANHDRTRTPAFYEGVYEYFSLMDIPLLG